MTAGPKARNHIPNFQSAIVKWFEVNARDLPWRRTSDPYRIWISEMMLQQTQVATVIPYYKRFLDRFPSLQILAKSSEEEVLKFWEGLGYYRRAKNLRLAAQLIVAKFDGEFPDTREALLEIPGIGPYSAGAILSIAFRKSTPALDGNLIRVYSRMYAVTEAVDELATMKRLWKIAKDHAPSESGRSREFAEGMMELGALICTPKNPLCHTCPVQNMCRAFRRKIVGKLPTKNRGRTREKLFEAVAVMRRKNKVALFPKGSDPKFPDFMRLPFCALPKKIIQTQKSFRYSVTYRDIEVFLQKELPSNGQKPVWVEQSKLSEILLPAIDRKILRAHLG
jgi:A/G-specific adenine glycosylase